VNIAPKLPELLRRSTERLRPRICRGVNLAGLERCLGPLCDASLASLGGAVIRWPRSPTSGPDGELSRRCHTPHRALCLVALPRLGDGEIEREPQHDPRRRHHHLHHLHHRPRNRLLFAVSDCWSWVIALGAEGPADVARRRTKKTAQAGAWAAKDGYCNTYRTSTRPEGSPIGGSSSRGRSGCR
jgi:hypothetical protein